MRSINIGATLIIAIFFHLGTTAQVKRIYVSNDDHTDYVWSDTELGYDSLIPNMLDRWIFINDSTKDKYPLNPEFQSKWNCDGSLWVAIYKNKRTATQFNRLIDQIRSGQITVPYSAFVNTYGGTPAEA